MRPIFLSLCLLFAINAVAQDDKLKNDTVGAKVTPSATEVYTYTDQMPEPGYDITKYLSEHLQYPDFAYFSGLQGRVILKFIVNEDGSISDCKVEKGIGSGCDEEAERVVKSMPKWKAGKKNGIPVRVWTMLPVPFDQTTTKNTAVYQYVEQMPRAGYDYQKYLAKNIHYPLSAAEKKITGRVIVKFVINEDGHISNCSVLKGIGGGLDEEAIRVVSNMPPWLPGKQNGKPVKVYFTLPINFML